MKHLGNTLHIILKVLQLMHGYSEFYLSFNIDRMKNIV